MSLLKLSASRLAQCFVHGDYYAIEGKDDYLMLHTKYLTETVPFFAWDGKCHIMRGLLWGTLNITVYPENKPAKTLSVYGLPWQTLTSFAKQLTAQYQAWLSSQKQEFTAVEPLLLTLVDEINNGDGFLRVTDLHFWQQQVAAIFQQKNSTQHVLASLNPEWSPLLFQWIEQGEAMREARNQAWTERELERHATWFDNIESSPLNLSQRNAVLMDENYNLLLAGAGSGKTSVLMAKVQYLISNQHILPERILMLAFGKKAQLEISERLAMAKIENVSVATFHGFASTLIKQVTGLAPVLSSLATDEESKMHWFSLTISQSFAQPAMEKRWLTHLSQWKIPGLTSEKSLKEQVNEPRFHRWFWRLIDLIVQQNLSQAEIKNITQHHPQQQSEAVLLWPLFRCYQKALQAKKELDFNGLILEATQCISRKNAPFSTFEYILVDEYQDISPARLALLDAICAGKQARKPSLFVVGDDWQAIYRFAGSDASLTTDFLTRFPNGVIGYLDMTYRFNSKIGEVANQFIQVNPKQLKKSLNSVIVRKKKAVHVIDSGAVEETLQKLATHVGETKSSVLLIGRNNANKPSVLKKWQQRWSNLQLQYVTAHSSKGLEADYTVILDVNEGTFPAKDRSEGLEKLLLATQDEMEYAEERRLFYVALTRARHICWISTNSSRPSPFIIELCQNDYDVNVKLKKKALSRDKQ